MAIRVENRNIILAVRDLVPATHHHQILSSFPLPQRGALGKKAQTWLQSGKKKKLGMFHTEYVINREYFFSDYTFFVSGRIDGVYKLPDRVEIEEIKSVILKKGEFAKVTVDLYPHFVEQLLFYAYLLQDELDGLEVSTFLVMINLVDNKDRIFPVVYRRAEVENKLHKRFLAIIDEIGREHNTKKKRCDEIKKIDFSLPESRKQQQVMINAVDKAIKEKQHLMVSAPTGTGKTAASLFPAIQNSYPENKRIMFVTSKTTQQEIVRETLKQITSQGIDLKISFLKAAGKMCANDIFFCHEAHCRFARDYRKRFDETGVLEKILQKNLITPDDVYKIAVENELCPFEVNVDSSLNCDVVVGDYNYVFDPAAQLRKLFFKKDLSDWILIIDEAHNLYERGRQYLSPQIGHRQVTLLKESLKNKKDKVYRSLDKTLTEIEELFKDLQREGESRYPDQQYFETDINTVAWQDHFNFYESAYITYLIYKIKKGILLIDDPLESFYFNFRRFLRVARFKEPSFVTYYNAADGGILNIQCCDPSTYLQEKIDSFHSVVAMSATLDPIKYYREVLGFPEYRTQILELDSPFPKENRQIIIIPGISTKYKDRSANYLKIAEVIKETIKLKKGNYLVFFPGYDFMQKVNIFLGNIPSQKIIQKPGLSEEERDQILQKLKQNDETYLLMAVMGGIFSEGVDYNGSMAIGVLVISPALPKYGYERELLNRYYENKNGSGKAYAYLYPGMNKVIQSVGRLIRSHTDKGIILLIGQRFAEDEFNLLLPDYWIDKKDDLVITEDYKKAIQSFWKKFN